MSGHSEKTTSKDSAGRAPAGDLSFSEVVENLCTAGNGLARRSDVPPDRRLLPSQEALVGVVEDLRSVLFPGYYRSLE
jgi:hypothetical protein